MTNAHIVAGSDSVAVEADGRSFDASVVSYDADADIVILDVPDLQSPPLMLDLREAIAGTDLVSLGYSSSGVFDATPARIREIIQLNGPNFYRTSKVTREVYTFRGHLPQGVSGGPLITRDGKVVGMAFGSATDDDDTGFALTAYDLSVQLAKLANTQRQPTGPCL